MGLFGNVAYAAVGDFPAGRVASAARSRAFSLSFNWSLGVKAYFFVDLRFPYTSPTFGKLLELASFLRLLGIRTTPAVPLCDQSCVMRKYLTLIPSAV